MTILTWLTLGYAAVLVLVLAVGLLTVWLRLRGIAAALGAARDALARVRDATGGLDEGIAPLRDQLLEAVQALESAADDLGAAGDRVRERSGAPAGAGR